MRKPYKFQGETFELDDSNGCYVKVQYRGQTGYVGVLTNPSAKQRFGRSITPGSAKGLNGGGSDSGDFQSSLDTMCGVLMENAKNADYHESLRAQACEEMHGFMNSLPLARGRGQG